MIVEADSFCRKAYTTMKHQRATASKSVCTIASIEALIRQRGVEV